jgi:hypothetical protein
MGGGLVRFTRESMVKGKIHGLGPIQKIITQRQIITSWSLNTVQKNIIIIIIITIINMGHFVHIISL